MNASRLKKITFFAIATLILCGLPQAYALKEQIKGLSKSKPKSVTLQAKGLFESTDMTEVKIVAEYTKSFKVKKAVKHGAYVKKGDVLVEFDMEDMDKEIKKLEELKKTSDENFEEYKFSFNEAEKSYKDDLKKLDSDFNEQKSDFDYFMKVTIARNKKSADFALQSVEFYVERSRDALRQLENMYKEDDLTEESEKIVLKRYEFSLVMAENSLKNGKNQHNHSMKVAIPRSIKQRELAFKEIKKTWSLNKIKLPHQRAQSKLTMKEKIKTRKKANENLKNLKEERENVTKVISEAEGYVYYGSCNKGSWSSSSFVKKLEKDGVINEKEVFMTIVPKGKLFFRTSFPEASIGKLKKGIKGTVSSIAFPKMQFSVKIKSIELIPVKQGSYSTIIEIDDIDFKGVMAGMAGNVKFLIND